MAANQSINFTQDPNDVLDYPFDYSQWLAAGETIVSSAWYPSPGIVVGTTTNAFTYTVVWLSGGSLGFPYTVQNRIVTSDGRTKNKSMTLRISTQ